MQFTIIEIVDSIPEMKRGVGARSPFPALRSQLPETGWAKVAEGLDRTGVSRVGGKSKQARRHGVELAVRSGVAYARRCEPTAK